MSAAAKSRLPVLWFFCCKVYLDLRGACFKLWCGVDKEREVWFGKAESSNCCLFFFGYILVFLQPVLFCVLIVSRSGTICMGRRERPIYTIKNVKTLSSFAL